MKYSSSSILQAWDSVTEYFSSGNQKLWSCQNWRQNELLVHNQGQGMNVFKDELIPPIFGIWRTPTRRLLSRKWPVFLFLAVPPCASFVSCQNNKSALRKTNKVWKFDLSAYHLVGRRSKSKHDSDTAAVTPQVRTGWCCESHIGILQRLAFLFSECLIDQGKVNSPHAAKDPVNSLTWAILNFHLVLFLFEPTSSHFHNDKSSRFMASRIWCHGLKTRTDNESPTPGIKYVN